MATNNKKYQPYAKKPYYEEERYRGAKRHQEPTERRYEHRKEEEYRKREPRDLNREERDNRADREPREPREPRDKPFVDTRPYRDAPVAKPSQYYPKAQPASSSNRPYYTSDRPKYSRRSRERERDRYSSQSRSYRRHRSRSSYSYSRSRSRSRSQRSRSYSPSSSYSQDSRRRRGSSRSPYRYRNRSPKREYMGERGYRGDSRERAVNVKRKDSQERRDYQPQYSKEFRHREDRDRQRKVERENDRQNDRQKDREKDRNQPQQKDLNKSKEEREEVHFSFSRNNNREKEHQQQQQQTKSLVNQIKNIPPPPPSQPQAKPHSITIPIQGNSQGPFLKRPTEPQKIQIDFQKIVYESRPPPPTLEAPITQPAKPLKKSPNQLKIEIEESSTKPSQVEGKPKRQKQPQFIRPEVIPKPPAQKPLNQTEQFLKSAKAIAQYKLPETSYLLLESYRRLDGYEFELEAVTQQWRAKLQDDKSSINLLRSQWINNSLNTDNRTNGEAAKSQEITTVPPRFFRIERSHFVNQDFQAKLEQLAEELRNKARIICQNHRKNVMCDIDLEMLKHKRLPANTQITH